MEKIAIYYRVSTSTQEKEETIKTQESVEEKIYKDRNVVKVYKDEGFSGAYLQRPALDQLRKDAREGLFNVLALYSLDRLSRNVGHQLLLQDVLKQNGVKVEIQGENLKDTPQGRFSTTVLSAVGELERATIKKRMDDGRNRRIDNGILVGCQPPFGYDLIKRDKVKGTEARFEINPERAKIVEAIFETFINEQGIRATARKIMGVKKFQLVKKSFQPDQIANILRHKAYIGEFYFGRTINFTMEENGELKQIRRPRPESEWKLIKVPPIISKTMFDKVQEILAVRSKNFIAKTKHNYLLQGLIKCIHCSGLYGGRRTRTIKGKSYFVYLCHNQRKPKMGQEKCKARSVSSKVIEDEVWEYVKNLVKRPEQVKKAIKEWQKEREDRTGSKQKVLDVLVVEKEKIRIKKSKILDLYAEGTYTKKDLDDKISEYNNLGELLDKQIKEAKKNLQKIEEMNKIEEEIESVCLKYRKIIDNVPLETKKLIVRKWVKEINVSDKGDIFLRIRPPLFEDIELEKDILTKSYTPLPQLQRTDIQRGIIEFKVIISKKGKLPNFPTSICLSKQSLELKCNICI